MSMQQKQTCVLQESHNFCPRLQNDNSEIQRAASYCKPSRYACRDHFYFSILFSSFMFCMRLKSVVPVFNCVMLSLNFILESTVKSLQQLLIFYPYPTSVKQNLVAEVPA